MVEEVEVEGEEEGFLAMLPLSFWMEEEEVEVEVAAVVEK